jgi:hypothetical protein
MNKKLSVERCAVCPFNEHDSGPPKIFRWTYLGVEFYKVVAPGGPALICLYRPKESLRDNFRGGGCYERPEPRFIYVATDDRFKGEFKKQLSGFPDWCPLEDDISQL